jgi:hypothetical protein
LTAPPPPGFMRAARAILETETVAPSETDLLLARYLGDNLQTATIRLIGGALGAAAIIALIVWLIR